VGHKSSHNGSRTAKAIEKPGSDMTREMGMYMVVKNSCVEKVEFF
jgi:hypothetical protein